MCYYRIWLLTFILYPLNVVSELTREMCLDLIEYATVDENNKGHKDRPRVIHVYYKLIDKPLTNKNRLALT